MKKWIALMLCLVLVLSLAACGETEPEPTAAPTAAPTAPPTEPPTTEPTEPPVTVESVYASVLDAMGKNEATRMKMDISFSASYAEGEGEDAVTTTVGYDMLMEIIVSRDPLHCYNLTSIAMETDGFSMDLSVDLYVVEEEGKIVTYSQLFGMWVREETEMNAEEFLVSGQLPEIDTGDIWDGGNMPFGMTLDEDTQMLDGTQVYVLRAQIPAEGLGEALVEMGLELDMDADSVSMPITYYVDAENYTILRADADMNALSDLMSAYLAESLVGSGADADAVKMNISHAIYELGYGKQDVPAVPQEAFDYLANSEGSSGGGEDEDPSWEESDGPQAADLGDGKFSLPCGTDTIIITTPEDWSGMVFNDYNIWLYSNDDTAYCDFYFLEGYTGEDVMELWIEPDLEWLQEDKSYGDLQDLPDMGAVTVKALSSETSHVYYAYQELDGGVLLIQISDLSSESRAEQLLTLLIDSFTFE